jgi:hypothetical protein
MKQRFYFGVVLALSLAATDHALAVPMQPIQPPALPLHKSAVFCGPHGCQPITKVKHCNVNSTQNVQPTATQGNIRRNCNF